MWNIRFFQISIFVLIKMWNSVDVETQTITTTTQRGEIRRCMARGARWAEFNFEQPYVLWYSVYGQCSRRRTKHQPPILYTIPPSVRRRESTWTGDRSPIVRWTVIIDRHFYLSFYPSMIFLPNVSKRLSAKTFCLFATNRPWYL